MLDQTDTQTAAPTRLFDDTGRRIPPVGLQAEAHPISRGYFKIDPQQIDYAAIHSRLTRLLPLQGAPDAAAFQARVEAALASLRADPNTADVLTSQAIPFMLPRATYADLGAAVEETYIPAVAAAFGEVQPDYDFTNHHIGGFGGKLAPAPGARQETLLARMADDVVVGVLLPCLPGYSVPAAREQMASLPEQFLLAGALEQCAAFVSIPDLLVRPHGYPPLLMWSGAQYDNDEFAPHFEAYGYNLTVNSRGHFGHANEYWSHALTVLA
ncbi:hypothetical protein [Magnetofaba australis]|uniref:Uncharacterized protein n=1 Tax=Magnetofaba australis IT-1 TaxID=1434232 RepID=A0A1Y2K8B3_9PROT|nr:hypothetical protein [Magnetofaba australis]OSM07001.1 hypothetical protein MAIT1_00097 [Magnetofaba australis IT-1]